MTKAQKAQELVEKRIDQYKVFRVSDLDAEDRDAIVKEANDRYTDSSTWLSKRGTTFINRAGMLSVEVGLDWEKNLRGAQDEKLGGRAIRMLLTVVPVAVPVRVLPLSLAHLHCLSCQTE